LWCSLRVLQLASGGSRVFETGEDEVLILPLSGSCSVMCDGERFEVLGRASPFERETDFAYVPSGATVLVTSATGGRFAIPGARSVNPLPFRYGPTTGVTVELRGAGSCSRRVNNLCMPGTFDAERLMVCEVLTPAGNWSSYPPHKHDEKRGGEEALEEIYYFEIAPGEGEEGVAYQRVYGTPERPIDLLAEVRNGDTVLVPHGWHGPSMAAPGYDLYYLNVMAGPGERVWLVRDDPVHAWIRATWTDQAIDPRLVVEEHCQ
jgi:5-deoxy-glucuronate isomerase